MKIFFYKQLTKYSLKYSNYHIVTSSNDKKTLENTFKMYTEKIVVLPNWVEIISPIKTKKKENEIISIGRLEKQKNFKNFIESFSNSDVVINIYGDGSEKNDLINLSRLKNVRVNFHGNLNNQSLIETLSKYRFFCTSTLYEGNPKAILEAMAAGCVVIAPNVQGVKNIIKNNVNGLIYDYSKSNPYEIYKKFIKINTNNLSYNAIKYVKENHNLETIAKKELGLYKELRN